MAISGIPAKDLLGCYFTWRVSLAAERKGLRVKEAKVG